MEENSLSKEDLALLAEISNFVPKNATLNRAEDSISGPALKLILEEIKLASGLSYEEKIAEILCPPIYQLCHKIGLKVDLEKILLDSMSVWQIEEYQKIAKETNNTKLSTALFYKSLGSFQEFRRLGAFKKKSLCELAKYLAHKFLNFETETQILEAVLWWLEFKLKKREARLKEALALVDWTKIKRGQLKFLICSKIGKKSDRLKQAFISIYMSKIKSRRRMKEILANNPEFKTCSGKEFCQNKKPLREKCAAPTFMLKVLFQDVGDETKKKHQVFLFYDVESGTIREEYFTFDKGEYDGTDDDGYFVRNDYLLHDYKLYAVGRKCRDIVVDGEDRLEFSIHSRKSFSKEWTEEAWFGRNWSPAVYRSVCYPQEVPKPNPNLIDKEVEKLCESFSTPLAIQMAQATNNFSDAEAARYLQTTDRGLHIKGLLAGITADRFSGDIIRNLEAQRQDYDICMASPARDLFEYFRRRAFISGSNLVVYAQGCDKFDLLSGEVSTILDRPLSKNNHNTGATVCGNKLYQVHYIDSPSHVKNLEYNVEVYDVTRGTKTSEFLMKIPGPPFYEGVERVTKCGDWFYMFREADSGSLFGKRKCGGLQVVKTEHIATHEFVHNGELNLVLQLRKGLKQSDNRDVFASVNHKSGELVLKEKLADWKKLAADFLKEKLGPREIECCSVRLLKPVNPLWIQN